jgi:ubiquinone/menaquinone biosynthesis C-methylase UbiE
MIRQIRAWRQMMRIGSARKLGTYFTEIFRYFALEVLRLNGLFDYLKEPHTYGEILAHFDFIDSQYTRDIFEVLVTDQHPVLLKEGERYRINPAEKLPTFDEVLERTDERYRGFAGMAIDLAKNIPLRMRGTPLEFSQSFDMPGREMMENFDELLSLKFYTINRDLAFAFLSGDDRKWLRGKRLLELGCGSGRETAELWNHLGGETHITATDTVESLLKLAEKSFTSHLDTINPAHGPITDANRPVFQVASVTQLPFEDNSFDAAFYCHIMHYTSDPRRAVREVTRVVRPDGLVFGIQIMKPYWSPFTDIVFRSNESSHGFFWREEHRRWYAENGFECETITPLGCFRSKGMRVRQAAPVNVPAPVQQSTAPANTQASAAPAAAPEVAKAAEGLETPG